MTLHWWMHWFWVTAHIVVIIGIPLPSSTSEEPQIYEESGFVWQNLTVKYPQQSSISVDDGDYNNNTKNINNKYLNVNDSSRIRDESTRTSVRRAKAINLFQPSMKGNTVGLVDRPMFRLTANASKIMKQTFIQTPQYDEESTINPNDNNKTNININSDNSKMNINKSNNRFDINIGTTNNFFNNPKLSGDDDDDGGGRDGLFVLQTGERIEDNYRNKQNNNPTVGQIYNKKRDDSKIIRILTTIKPQINIKTNINDDIDDNISINNNNHRNYNQKLFDNFNNKPKNLSVLPIRIKKTHFKIFVNRTLTTDIDTESSINTGLFNSSEDIEIDQEFTEPRLSSGTIVPVLHADIAESTRFNRAFASEFQRAQDRSSLDDDPDDIINSNRDADIIRNINAESKGPSVVDIAAITGSCLAMIVLLSTIATLGFLMYRRKYLNPPQTLNSDKCSNPDSSGYIDDSTIRDNSEEMYSLDNDSFLNSLEAMTIQNYWTDSVKHTKL